MSEEMPIEALSASYLSFLQAETSQEPSLQEHFDMFKDTFISASDCVEDVLIKINACMQHEDISEDVWTTLSVYKNELSAQSPTMNALEAMQMILDPIDASEKIGSMQAWLNRLDAVGAHLDETLPDKNAYI